MLNSWQTLNILVAAGFCLCASNSVAQDSAAQRFAEMDKRVAISRPAQQLEVGKPYALSLALSGPPVTQVVVSFESRNGYLDDPNEQTPAIQHRADGSAYVNVTPPQLGKTTMHVLFVFSDDEASGQAIPIDVKLGSETPVKFALVMRGSTDTQNSRIHELDLDFDKTEVVGAHAWYPNLKTSVQLPASEIKFNVLANGTPPIKIDPKTGRMEALQVGHAILEATFAGLTSRNCVIVTQRGESATTLSCDDLMSRDVFDAEGETSIRHPSTIQPRAPLKVEQAKPQH